MKAVRAVAAASTSGVDLLVLPFTLALTAVLAPIGWILGARRAR